MKRPACYSFTLLIVLVLCLPAAAGIEIYRSAAGSGGGRLSNTGFQLLHTVGQPVIGEAGCANYISHAGLWYVPWFFVTGVDEHADLFPGAYRLDQNYPNPFNPATTIQFVLPRRSRVSLKVYDVLGREAAVIVDGEMEPGVHQVTLHARHLASGVYFCRMKAGSFVETKKMILVR